MAVTGHGPDESSLILDSGRDTGYFGSFSSFISPSSLESAVGIAVENPNYYYDYESNSEHAGEVSNLWMKFYYKGKYLFVPKTPLGWAEWSRIYHRGAVFGNDLAWPTDDATFWRTAFSTDFDRLGIETPILQNRRVSIGAYSYKVRLLSGYGGETGWWGGWPDPWCEEQVGVGSEWNELIYRTLIIDPVLSGAYNKYADHVGAACSTVDRYYYAHGGTDVWFGSSGYFWDSIPQSVHELALYPFEGYYAYGGLNCYTKDICWEGYDDSAHVAGEAAPFARGGAHYFGSYHMSGLWPCYVAGKGSFGFAVANQASWLPCLELDIEQIPDENSTGSVILPVVQLSGSGQQVSYGIISIPLFTFQGYGVNQFTAVGDVVLPRLKVIANTRSFGKITFPGLSLYGRAYSESFANGTISLGKVGIKGTVVLENFGGMYIPMPKLKVSGSAKVLKIMTGNGEVTLPAAGVSGVAYNGEPFDFTTSDEIVFKYDPSRGLI
jgi:hypothetical protein